MTKYILDTNVYIQAHTGYYSPAIAPNYWDLLKELGSEDLIKSPKQVKDELSQKDSGLSTWKKNNKIFLDKDLDNILTFLDQVRDKYKEVKAKNYIELQKTFKGKYTPSRDEPLSDPDMFVIATVLFYKKHFPAIKIVLVTKESRSINASKSVRIPHVCDALAIKCIDDFEFLKEVGIRFEASRK